MDSLFRALFEGFTKETPWLSALLVGLVTFYLAQLWMKVKHLPPGPIPLPIIGNMLSFVSSRHTLDIMMDFKKRYGGIFTIFAAGKPFVIVADWELAKEGLIQKKNDIIARSTLRSFLNVRKDFIGIVHEDNDRKWEVTRKVAAGAIRKFVESEQLATIVHNDTIDFIERMLKVKGRPLDPKTDIQILVMNIIAETAFGDKTLTEEEYKTLMGFFNNLQELFGNTPGDMAPWLLVLYYNRDLALRKISRDLRAFLKIKFHDNKKTYQRGVIRNFTDAVMTSGFEALEDDGNAKEYLDDENMMKVIGALFVAAIETTVTSLRWMLLLMCNFPEVQERIVAEIEENIGNRMPVQSDRKNCPYTWAFMAEALRFRTGVPLGVPHATGVDTQLGEHKIKKGNIVVFFSHAIHMDPKIFPEPEKFKPERFLKDDGSFNLDRTGFMAFGEGKRICVGEKMGRNDIFLVLATLLQKVRLRLDGPPGSADLQPQNTVLLTSPKQYRIIVLPKDK